MDRLKIVISLFNGIFKRHSSCYTIVDSSSANSASGEFQSGRYGHYFSAIRHSAISRLISILNKSRGPYAVARGIIAIIVYALDAVIFRRAISHVRIKISERLPPGTNLDAASAIPVIHFIRWFIASPMHVAPCSVLRAVAFAMNKSALRHHLSGKASTRLHSPRFQVDGQSRCNGAAVAYTFPPRLTGSAVFCSAYDGQAMEASASQINAFGHKLPFLFVRRI